MEFPNWFTESAIIEGFQALEDRIRYENLFKHALYDDDGTTLSHTLAKLKMALAVECEKVARHWEYASCVSPKDIDSFENWRNQVIQNMKGAIEAKASALHIFMPDRLNNNARIRAISMLVGRFREIYYRECDRNGDVVFTRMGDQVVASPEYKINLTFL